jgi:hypothetical protein
MNKFYPQNFKQTRASFPPKQNRTSREVIRQDLTYLLKKRQYFCCSQKFWDELKFGFPLIDTLY